MLVILCVNGKLMLNEMWLTYNSLCIYIHRIEECKALYNSFVVVLWTPTMWYHWFASHLVVVVSAKESEKDKKRDDHDNMEVAWVTESLFKI